MVELFTRNILWCNKTPCHPLVVRGAGCQCSGLATDISDKIACECVRASVIGARVYNACPRQKSSCFALGEAQKIPSSVLKQYGGEDEAIQGADRDISGRDALMVAARTPAPVESRSSRPRAECAPSNPFCRSSRRWLDPRTTTASSSSPMTPTSSSGGR